MFSGERKVEKRKGECKRCGACCKSVRIPCASKPDIPWVEAHGGEVLVIDGKFYMEFPFPCENLAGNVCLVYEVRPFSCRMGPTGKKDLAKGCGFSFEEG